MVGFKDINIWYNSLADYRGWNVNIGAESDRTADSCPLALYMMLCEIRKVMAVDTVTVLLPTLGGQDSTLR